MGSSDDSWRAFYVTAALYRAYGDMHTGLQLLLFPEAEASMAVQVEEISG